MKPNIYVRLKRCMTSGLLVNYSVQNKTKNIWLPNHNGAAFMKGIVQCIYKLLRNQERNAKEKSLKKKCEGKGMIFR